VVDKRRVGALSNTADVRKAALPGAVTDVKRRGMYANAAIERRILLKISGVKAS
jgi:hypothetical protein